MVDAPVPARRGWALGGRNALILAVVVVAVVTMVRDCRRLAPLPVGGLAPDFRAPRLDGGELHLADYRGQVVLLDFWASWCAPCIAAMPGLSRLHDRFAARGLVLVGVNLAENRQAVEAFARRARIRYPIALDLDSRIANAYRVSTIPQVLVLDRDGVIRYSAAGSTSEPALDRALTQLMGGPSPP
jgi:peroxiredoxin